MSLFTDITFRSPVIRVEERDRNLEFLQKNLGMKLVSEENALAFLSGHASKEIRFIIEESPTYRTRAVEGTKKLNCLVIKAQAAEIAQLLVHGAETRYIFKGKEGYAFETVSPQGDAILIHAEKAIEDLEQVTSVEADIDSAFKGLSDFHVEEVVLNVPDPGVSQAFYQEAFEGQLPLNLSFETAEGPDLTIEPQMTWDIEFFDFQVPEDYDLLALYDYLDAKDLAPYIDKKARVVVVSDPSNIEIWFSK
ncbi:CppA N-terminal domain-containing protein [Streptococcus sp. ZJ151]|uniref:CppA N-terminal domain-containing protein n=1 Tax=Streptococcus jiangjianxini TaxID=3161189 RepID=UPI0032EC4682